MSFTEDQIRHHYAQEAQKHGEAGTSTIQDIKTRRLEIQALFSYFRDGMKILEVGCGNGFTAREIVENYEVDLDAVDFSPELIRVARNQSLKNVKGRVTFREQDILSFDVKQSYDLIFTERCLQNLTSWDSQRQALVNIARALKANGEFIMLESFHTGLDNLNKARAELDLPEIKVPWHNLFFYEKDTVELLAEHTCRYIDQNSFLSGYYFGSRVLLPAITPKHKKVASGSMLNEYFCHLPPAGDFCPMKIIRFKKS